MECTSTPETMKVWPHAFRLEATVEIDSESSIHVFFTEENTDTTPFESAWAFHPYFAVSNVCALALDGVRLEAPTVLRSFAADGQARVLADIDGGREIVVSCSDNTDWTLWNPGVARTPLCETLGPDEWRRFFCVEPSSPKPSTLHPGEKRTHRLDIAIRKTGG